MANNAVPCRGPGKVVAAAAPGSPHAPRHAQLHHGHAELRQEHGPRRHLGGVPGRNEGVAAITEI